MTSLRPGPVPPRGAPDAGLAADPEQALPHATGDGNSIPGLVLDQINAGLIVVDGAFKVLTANSAGRDYLDRGDALALDGDALRAEIGHETVKLRALIRSAVELGRPCASLVSRTGSSQRLQLIVKPLVCGDGAEARALVTVYEPGRGGSRLTEGIKAVFGLTPAEAAIVAQIALGAGLDEIAAGRGVSANTLRAQIASAMAKMGLHRQAEFGAAVLGLDVFA